MCGLFLMSFARFAYLIAKKRGGEHETYEKNAIQTEILSEFALFKSVNTHRWGMFFFHLWFRRTPVYVCLHSFASISSFTVMYAMATLYQSLRRDCACLLFLLCSMCFGHFTRSSQGAGLLLSVWGTMSILNTHLEFCLRFDRKVVKLYVTKPGHRSFLLASKYCYMNELKTSARYVFLTWQ